MSNSLHSSNSGTSPRIKKNRSRSGASGVVDNEPGASSAQDSSSSSDLADRTLHVVVSNSSLDTEHCTFVASNNQPMTHQTTSKEYPERSEAARRFDKEKHEEKYGEE